MYDALVLGAGVVGINTAYWLAKSGYKVAVIDRQPQPGKETSFANGGQISVSHAEPWANPSAPWQVLKWLWQGDAPLQFSPRFDHYQWRWLLNWLWQCMPRNCRHNMKEIIQLSAYSQRLLREISTEHQLQYQQRDNGILHFYCDQKTWQKIPRTARIMQDYGCHRQVLDKGQVLALEPALQPIAKDICGGTYTSGDFSANAYEYCQQLLSVCRQMGVDFHFDSQIQSSKVIAGDVTIKVRNHSTQEELYAPVTVCCLGSWSALFLRQLGIDTDIYPAKGYSLTIPIENMASAPQTSLTDDEHKLVFSRLGDKLRVAGTAELSGYNQDISPERIWPLLERTRQCFPDLGNYQEIEPWCGLRPATPSNLPYIEKAAAFKNLWLNTGHGTLGWTMGCGAGKLLADMVNNPQNQYQTLLRRQMHGYSEPYSF